MKVQPYVGVTGFTKLHEVIAATMRIPHDTDRKLMVGVLVNEKSLNEQSVDQPERYPRMDKVQGLLRDDPRCLNLIHYHTKHNDETLIDQLKRLEKIGGAFLHGFQLNVKWPNIDAMREYKQFRPDHVFVLQCGGGALESVKYDAAILCERICEYKGVADYVLIDPSGGRGNDIDIDLARDFLAAVSAGCPWIRVGIAGGFGPESIRRVCHLAERFTEMSVDAEGKLRDEQDHLMIVPMKTYLERGFGLFSVCPS